MGFLDKQGLTYFWGKVKTYVDSKLSGVPVKPITQAEYGALSEEEKNEDVLYLLTDAASSSGSGPGSSEDIYSLEEQMVGRWIDEKPVYQRTVIVNIDCPAVDATTKFLDLDTYLVDTLVQFDAFTSLSWNSNILMDGSYGTDFTCSENWLAITQKITNSNAGKSLTIRVTFRYTKTIDIPEEVTTSGI